MTTSKPVPSIAPNDSHNQRLIANVHPRDWVNPEPARRYNLVVIGAGTAGLICAAASAGLGAKVALVERELMGGDCLNVGCVPSKAIIRSARVAADANRAASYGLRAAGGIDADFGKVMERMRRLRADLSDKDSASRYRDLGVDVFIGEGRFASRDSVEVNGRRLRFSRAVIATGSRAAPLPIPGLAQAGYLTNETIFSLTSLPKRLAIVGAGPIGCELAQAFRRFGSEVSLLEAESGILPREDRDAAAVVRTAILGDGIDLVEGCRVEGVTAKGDERLVMLECGGHSREIACDKILVAAGRIPVLESLNLEAAGIEYDRRVGVKVNDHLQTTNRRTFAAGDICSKYKFTHISDAMARIVIRNALFFGRDRFSALTIPYCTYTDPEIAHVGLYEHEAEELGVKVKTFVQSLNDIDRAILDGEAEGFIKVHVREGTDKIVGATAVASHAGEIISELTLAMVGGLGLSTISRTIHPYPTQAEAIRKIGDAYNRTRLTPLLSWIFEKLLAFRR